MADYWDTVYLQQSKNWWWQGKEKVIQFFLNKYGQLSAESEVLDIGCGPGFTLKVIDSYGIGFGIDVCDAAIDFAKQQGCLRILKASAQALPFQADVFDGITLIDSLEHMDNEARVIAECHRVLKSEGFLLLTVPAYQSLWTYRDVYFGHKRRYSYAMLNNLLNQKGFRVKRISHTNSFLLPVLFILSIFEQISGGKTGVNNEGVKSFHPFINKFLYGLLRLEALLISRFNLPFGSSIICLAKKIK